MPRGNIRHGKSSYYESNQLLRSNGHALNDNTSGTLLIDAGAFLFSGSAGDAAFLTGSWTITVNGELGAFGATYYGLVLGPNAVNETSTITLGKSGEIFGVAAGLTFNAISTITNKGGISGGSYGRDRRRN